MGAIYKLGSKFAGLVAWCTQQATTTSTATSDKPAVIKENYYDSTTGNWYRIWSDGWIEQGGAATSGVTYTFLKPYVNTPKLVVGFQNMWSSPEVPYFYISQLSSTTFKTSYSSGTVTNHWYACGY